MSKPISRAAALLKLETSLPRTKSLFLAGFNWPFKQRMISRFNDWLQPGFYLSSDLMRIGTFCSSLALIVLSLGGPLCSAFANEPTAFELIKEGNRHLGEEAKDQVTQIRSAKSIGTLTPNIWYVIY